MIQSHTKSDGKLKVVLVDDEPLALEVLFCYISKLEDIDIVASFENPKLALSYLHQHEVDVLFLDIYMPELSGLELMQSLQCPPMVIFTTASIHHAVTGFELDAVDYLLKPISFERFESAVCKAREKIKQKQRMDAALHSMIHHQGFTVKANKRHIDIPYEEVLFIKGLKDYVVIKLRSGQVVALQKMKYLEHFLPTSIFKRIHKSYIVNLHHIHSIDGNKVEMMVAEKIKEIPIGRIYKGSILNLITQKKI